MFLENKQLDKNVPIPLYFQLKEAILSEIKGGAYPVDSIIPTENELSAQFEISRTTVRQAITELVQEGWLYRVKSKGTFICRPKISQDFIQKVENFNVQITRLGLTPTTKVLVREVMEATAEVAEMLQIPVSEKVIYLQRRRYADENAIVMVETYLPYEACKQILEHNLETESLYEVLSRKRETCICTVKRVVEAVEATTEDTKNLDIKKGKPIQLFHSIGRNEENKAIEYSIARYRGDRSKFEVMVFVDTKK